MSCPPKLLFSPPNDPYEKKLTCVSKYIDPSSLFSCSHFTIIVCYHEVMSTLALSGVTSVIAFGEKLVAILCAFS